MATDKFHCARNQSKVLIHFRKKTKQESRGLSMAQNVIFQIPAILEHHGIELTINIQYFIFIYVDP